MGRRAPDRLPVMELAIDWKVMQGLGYRDYFDMMAGLELDVVPVDQVLYLLGGRKLLSRWFRTYRDEWGVLRRFTDDLLPTPVGHPILRAIAHTRGIPSCRPNVSGSSCCPPCGKPCTR